MELATGSREETGEARRRQRAEQAAQRHEAYEAQRRLEHFANPQDAYQQVDPEDADLDLQIRLFRGLARQSCLFPALS